MRMNLNGCRRFPNLKTALEEAVIRL
jgi:hypothetical protein